MAFMFDISPLTGPVIGATEVMAYGASFNSTATYEFEFGEAGGRVAGEFVDSNQIRCSSPAVANAGYVKLALFVDSELYGDYVDYLYYADPQVISISPTCGPTEGHTTVMVTGKHFVRTGPGKVKCLFGDTYTPATVVSSDLIACDSPEGVVGTVKFGVTLDYDEANPPA
jgi:hypothetical protein